MSVAAPMKRQALLAARLKLCRPKSLRKSQSIHRSFLSQWGVARAAIAKIFLRAMSSARIVAVCRDTPKNMLILQKSLIVFRNLGSRPSKALSKMCKRGPIRRLPISSPRRKMKWRNSERKCVHQNDLVLSPR